MKSFLEYVAEDIIRKYGTQLARVAVVFPNKRASLFLDEHLAHVAGRPLWSPAYITISDLFRQHSRRSVADPIKLVCDLHKSFTRCTGIDETLDHFYSWGELMLSDFDDIDKNMADASKVLANVRDIHELDDISYLTDEQRTMLQQFFSNFSADHNSELKERFLRLWSRFYDIYTDFNKLLADQQLAYEGALYREVAQNDDTDFKYDMYLFVGFNMMQRAEQMLCRRLMQQGKARFYWDFDRYYTSGPNVPEAGHYIAQYLEAFPNELDVNDDDIYNHLADTDKHISYISAPTENIQARYVTTWLREGSRMRDGRRTAIVMCNEGLLQTVIHCIPDEVDKVNVTTGYPLSQTPVASFIMLLLAGNRKALMRHPYYAFAPDDRTPDVDTILAAVRAIATSRKARDRQATEDDPLTDESLYRAYTLLNRVSELIGCGDLTVDRITLQRLISQIIRATTIPFHGEPAEGIQVMGVLETRNLDFDHLLILSCNEGNMPKGVNDSSFIPYSIRKAYQLTTIDNKVAIYAYYFHRLIQRASDITILYNNSTEDGHTGEMSRFMLQLMVESRHKILPSALQAGQITISPSPYAIQKTPEVAARLQRISYLSPTAINRYLRCPLQFYYYHIVGIKEATNNENDEIDNRTFGDIFHLASQRIYQFMMSNGTTITQADIDHVLHHPEIVERYVDRAIARHLFDITDESPLPQLNGLQIINRQVIIHYLRQLLTIDRSLAPFTILGLELPVRQTVSLGSQRLEIGGTVDRIDLVDIGQQSERIRVVDYKTGKAPSQKVHELANVFDPACIKGMHADYHLQAMLYSLIVSKSPRNNPDGLAVSPALLFIQRTQGDNYDPTLTIGNDKVSNIEDYRIEFEQYIEKILMEIFNANQPFEPTEIKDHCETCPYRQLCGV